MIARSFGSAETGTPWSNPEPRRSDRSRRAPVRQAEQLAWRKYQQRVVIQAQLGRPSNGSEQTFGQSREPGSEHVILPIMNVV